MNEWQYLMQWQLNEYASRPCSTSLKDGQAPLINYFSIVLLLCYFGGINNNSAGGLFLELHLWIIKYFQEKATQRLGFRRPGLDVISILIGYNILLSQLIYLELLPMLILDLVPESRIRGQNILGLGQNCRANPSALRSV